jgi:hypothetical protein
VNRPPFHRHLRIAPLLAAICLPSATLAIDTRASGETIESSEGIQDSEEIVALLGPVPWTDNLDGYVTDTNLHGQGGWKGWGNSPGAGAPAVDDQALSTPNSVEIAAAADLVQEYVVTSGKWFFRTYQFIPGTFAGDHYFILLNRYVDGCTTSPACNWSTQLVFDSVADTVSQDLGTVCVGSLPIVYDQWVELQIVIDLDANLQTVLYGGQQLFQCSWTGGGSGAGDVSIDAVDLFANNATPVYYDDFSLLPPEIFADDLESGDTSAWSYVESP